jgi:hypothetical protein
MSDAHASNYYATSEPVAMTQVGPVENWSLPADSISGPVVGAGGLGTNQSDFAGLSKTPPNDIVNSYGPPLPPGDGLIPTI